MSFSNYLQYKLLSALIAFVLWGSWAFYVNIASVSRLTSAIAQGSASFIITVFMVLMVQWLYVRFSKNRFYYILPAIVTTCFTGSALIIIHFLVGTANITSTILPPMTVAFIFCLFTTYKIHKETSKIR